MIKIVKYLTICSIGLIVGSNTSLAGERTGREMLSIAYQHFSSLKGKHRASAADKIERLKEGPGYCIYGSQESGFVVISRDDSQKPVLGYSSNQFDSSRIPCGMQWWLETISNVSLQALGLNHVTETTVVPCDEFISTKWGQGYPYNDKTPLVDEKHTPTGCVATALAQILNYYKYPVQGSGAGYYILGESDAEIPETISSVYEWGLMKNSYASGDFSDEEKDAIANLMKEAGLASHMHYDSQNSGAFISSAALGLAYNFSYDSLAIHYCDRSFYNDSEWMDMVYNELSNGHPILYGGQDENNGGHAFVLDGVDANGLVHVNWGWDGNGDGYFDISELNPKVGNTLYQFNLGQEMVFGFRCNPTPTADEKYKSLWCTSNNYTISLKSKLLTLTAENVYNYHFLTFWGTIGVAIESTDNDYSKDKYYSMTIGSTESASKWGMTSVSGSKILSGLSQGTYRVFLASKAIQDDFPQPVRTKEGIVCYTMQVDETGKATLSEKLEPYATGIKSITASSLMSPTRIFDLQGREVPSTTKGLLIRKQGDEVKKVMMK